MKLGAKIHLLLGLSLAVLILVLYGVSGQVVRRGFSELEEDHTRRNLDRVLRAVAARVSDLETSVRDWAYWDATYDFVRDRNEGYSGKTL